MGFKRYLWFLFLLTLALLISCGGGDGDSGTADNTDTDGDGIADVDDSDIDGDGLNNTDEFTFGTDPLKTDTDGDGWDDGVELSLFDSVSDPYKFNPKIADMPRLQVQFEGSPQIMMEYTTTEGVSESFTSEEAESFETSRSVSNSYAQSYSTEYGWSLEASVGIEVELSATDIGATMSASLSSGAHGTYTNQDSYTWEESQSLTNQSAYSRARTVATEASRSEIGGTISLPISILNNGDIAYTISSLSLTAYKVAADASGGLGKVIGTLESEGAIDFTIPPGSSTQIINFQNDSLYVNEVLDLLADSKSIVVDVAGYSVTATTSLGDTDFSYENTLVSAQTAKVVIDYGPTVLNTGGTPREEEQYNVATLYKYNANYSSMNDRYLPVTLADIMQTLQLTYQTGTYNNNKGLISLQNVDNDIPNNKAWYVAHFYTRGNTLYRRTYDIKTESFEFDALEVHAGDTVHLIYSEDFDGDGLPVRIETLFGTSDENTDTDGDTLTDFEETSGWDLAGETVYTNPILDDTDQDGILDHVDSEPNTPYLSSDTAISSYQVNGVDSTLLSAPVLIDNDYLGLSVTPQSAVLSVGANGVSLTKSENVYFAMVPLELGSNTINITVTALDNVTTQTTSFDVESGLAPVTGFQASNSTGEIDRLTLYWSLPSDSRVNTMLIVRSEGSAVGAVTPGLYNEGDNAGNGTVIYKYTVDDAFATENVVDSGLSDGTVYHYAAINVREDAGNVYTFSELVTDSAETDEPPPGNLVFRLRYLEDLQDNDGSTANSEVYYQITASRSDIPYPLDISSRLYSHVSMNDAAGDNHYYSFYTGLTTASRPLQARERIVQSIPRVDGLTVEVTVKIWEYDGGEYDQDLNGGNDDTIGNQLYVLEYDETTDSWSCQSTTPSCIGVEGYSDTTYNGSGTILLNMGVWWEDL